MTALACKNLLESGAGSSRLAGDSCARLRNQWCCPCENCCSCPSETVQHTAVTPSRMDQAAQLPPTTTLRSFKSP